MLYQVIKDGKVLAIANGFLLARSIVKEYGLQEKSIFIVKRIGNFKRKESV